MANALFRWTLTNLSDNSTDVLTKDPIGWDESTFTIKRDAFYKGVIQDYTVQLKFHCEGGGKQFIDNVYNTEDIDGRIQILIEYRCDPLSDEFATLYTGIINLASYTTDGTYTTCNIERGGIATKLKSRDEVSVNLESIESVGEETITVVQDNILDMAGQQIYFRMESELTGIESQVWFDNILVSVTYRGYVVPNILTIWQDAETYGGFQEYNDYAINGPAPTETFYPPIFEADDLNIKWPATFNYEYEIAGTFYDEIDVGGVGTNTRSYSHQLGIVAGFSRSNSVDPGQQYIEIYDGDYTTSLHQYVDNFSLSGSGTITLRYNEALYLRWWRQGAMSVGVSGVAVPQLLQWDYTTFRFKMDIASEFLATECKSVLVHEALTQTCDAILDTDDTVYSEFYGRKDSDKRSYPANGDGSFLAITNGLNIRAFPDTPVFCVLKELFESLTALHNVGLGIEADPADATRDIVRVEPLGYFYDGGTTILTLPNVDLVNTRNDNTRYFNSVDIGYSMWETEYRGGLDEPNTNREYSTVVSSVKTMYKRISKYIASSYSIEFTRRRGYDRFPTSDYRTDNDNFFIAVNRSVDGSDIPDALNLPELRPDAFSSATGMLPDIDIDKVLNLRLTPARMLLAHIEVITSGLQIIQDFIKFIRGDGNTAVETNMIETTTQESYSGATLAESQSFAWNDANVNNIAPLTSTEIYSFKYPLTYAQFVLVRANPYGLIAFTDYTGTTKSGFILNMEFELKTGITSFELIKA